MLSNLPAFDWSLSPSPSSWRLIADGTVLRLARILRFAGYDVEIERHPDRAYERAKSEGRVLLTRNRRKFSGKKGVFILYANDLEEQLHTVFQHFPQEIQMGTRCVLCNGTLTPIPPSCVRGRVPLYVYLTAPHFHRCSRCGHITWPGTHVRRVFSLLFRVWSRSYDPTESE